MVTRRINGKKYELPGCYEEMSTRVFQRIHREWRERGIEEKVLAKRDYFQLFGILTETDFALQEPTPELDVSISNCIEWYVTQSFNPPRKLPTVLLIDGRMFDVPKRVGSLGSGQNIMLRQSLNKAKYLEENISRALAVYLQPLYDGGKFDYERALLFEQKFLDMPIYHTYALGFFLLNRAMRRGWMLTNALHQIKISLKHKLKAALQKWRRLTGSDGSMIYR